jgi:hypothetical protein
MSLHERAARVTQTSGIEIWPRILRAGCDGRTRFTADRLGCLRRRIGMDLLRQSRESDKTGGRNGGHSYGVDNFDHDTVPVPQPSTSLERNAFPTIWLLFSAWLFGTGAANHP